MNEQIKVLDAQIRECFGRVIYSHKTHEKAADIYLTRLKIIKNSQIILSVLTTGSILANLFNIFGLAILAQILSAIFSIVLLVLNAYSRNFNLGELVQKHRDTANKLWKVREDYLSLLTDIKAETLKLDLIQSKRDSLQDELESIYSAAPPTFAKAYKLAQTTLQINEEFTFNDQEINKFLPKLLQKDL